MYVRNRIPVVLRALRYYEHELMLLLRENERWIRKPHGKHATKLHTAAKQVLARIAQKLETKVA
jgi:hypothetical protein